MSEDLKPCPFCGGTNIELRDNGIGDSYAICYSNDPSEMACGARTDDANCETDEGAISRWNKRASPPGGEWQGIDTAPRDGTAIIFINQWEHCSDVVRWRPAYDKGGLTFPGRYENKSGNGTGMNDDTAWLFWSASPLPAPPREAVGVGIEGASRTESTDARCDATAEDAHNHSEGED